MNHKIAAKKISRVIKFAKLDPRWHDGLSVGMFPHDLTLKDYKDLDTQQFSVLLKQHLSTSKRCSEQGVCFTGNCKDWQKFVDEYYND